MFNEISEEAVSPELILSNDEQPDISSVANTINMNDLGVIEEACEQNRQMIRYSPAPLDDTHQNHTKVLPNKFNLNLNNAKKLR